MGQKPGGGYEIRALAEDRDHSWLEGFSKNYEKKRAEEMERRREGARIDEEHWAKSKANVARMEREYAPLLKKVQKNMQWWPDEEPIPNSKWEEIQRGASEPSMGLEMTDTRARAVAEANRPDQGIFGFGLLGAVRKLVGGEIEKSEEKREAARLLNRGALF